MRETFAIFYLALTRPFGAPSPRGGLILHYGYWPAKQKFILYYHICHKSERGISLFILFYKEIYKEIGLLNLPGRGMMTKTKREVALC